MKTILSSRKHHYLKRVSIFLIVLALVAGMAGCGCGVDRAQYNLTMAVAPPGSGTATDLTDESPYAEGTEVSIKAEANEGYGFVNWAAPAGEFDDATAEETTFTMPAQNVTVTANFDVAYNLTISSTAGGSVTTPGEGTFSYAQGTVVNLVATPAGGYYFVNWTGDVGTIANVNAVTTTITINDNYNITANFEQIPPGKFALTTSSTAGGSVTTPGEATFIYDQGTVVNLVATPAGGYYFVNWTGDVGTIANVNAATTTITMNDNYHITANFKISQGQFTLTTSSTAGGSVTTPGEGTFTYNADTVVNLVATPAGGYRFVNWTGDVGTIANINAATTTITMKADYSITANFVAVYDLTMAVAPPGSGTATDLTNASPYPAGTVVSIKAQATAGYQFVIWAAPAGTFANPNAATTTFTMPAQNVTVTAHFVGPLDHFNCYMAVDERGPIPVGEVVYLEDQFGDVQAEVGYAAAFFSPVEKTHDGVTPISNPDHHLTFYSLDYEEEPQMWQVEVDNQFGIQQLIVEGPVGLAVPTQKEGHEPPVGLDHFLLYDVIEGQDVDVYVGLDDQFPDEPGGPEPFVTAPIGFAIPVRKTHGGVVTEIEDPEAHLVFYEIEGAYLETEVEVVNQFGAQTLDMAGPYYLAVPSEKKVIEPPLLDHFKCYWAEDVFPKAYGEVVYLEDQFGAVEAEVGYAELFCNPVEKWHDEGLTWIWHPDHHLTLYSLDYEESPQMWWVEVDNQFGTQQLTVYGPLWLAVPTRKVEPGGHDPPVGLDHFLVYEVIAGPYMEVVVGLNDQFSYEPEVVVTEPAYFANPVRKTHGGAVTEVENPDEHLVFYEILGSEGYHPQVQVDNQFGAQTLNVYDPALLSSFLAVPSEKKTAEKITHPLDHFKCYGAVDMEGIWPEVVSLDDQFVAVEADVGRAWYFCNPVEKWHDGVPTPISNPDHHLTLYNIYYEEAPQTWLVMVNNQFGYQQLTVTGPYWLAVPTQKVEPGGHKPPVGLDHFLLYEVIAAGLPVDEYVDLWDQFGYDPGVSMTAPAYFANPVQKTDDGGIVTPIENPEAHLVFYWISGGVSYPQVLVDNQFGEQTLDVFNPALLAVPSEKVYYDPIP